MNISFSVICYSPKRLKDGTNPLMLRINRNGQRKYHSVGISIDPAYWDFDKNKPKRNCPNRESIQQIIRTKETELQKHILSLQSNSNNFTLEDILKPFEAKKQAKSVGEFYESLIQSFIKSGATGNSRIYNDSYRSLKSFKNNRLNFTFNEITLRWLDKYEYWLRSKGCAETTMSVLFRTLRSAYNKAVDAGVADKKHYPFTAFKISKFDVCTKKRAISKEDIVDIMNADLSDERQYVRLSRDIFVFSYLCGGISFADIANLTNENITEGRLHYTRQKTGKKINLPMQSEAIEIILRYTDVEREYLFPILDIKVHITPIQKHNRIHKVIAKVNSCLKEIAKNIDLDINLTTYVARHTFATVLKRSGVNIGIISESLGHSDLATTQIYLDSFENSQIDEAMKNLL